MDTDEHESLPLHFDLWIYLCVTSCALVGSFFRLLFVSIRTHSWIKILACYRTINARGEVRTTNYGEPMRRKSPRQMVILLVANVLWITAPSLRAQPAPPTPAILFIGNSFTFAAGSPVRFYRASTVTDLNNEGIGGVPALFKAFTLQAGQNFNVSLETSGGKNFDWHLANKSAVLAKPWDYVVMHGYSTLDQKNPGDPALLVKSGKELAALLIKENPKVDIRLLATWSRADQTYPEKG